MKTEAEIRITQSQPGITWSLQKQEETRKDSLINPPGEKSPDNTLILEFCKKINFPELWEDNFVLF